MKSLELAVLNPATGNSECGYGITMNNLSDIPGEGLRELLQQSRQVLISLVQSLHDRPDMQNAIRRLMPPDGKRPTSPSWPAAVVADGQGG
jgi:hypothetical protein